jgi:cyclopropane fatty-acyl-phospholipid synthase-like methyltransferase
MSLQTTIRHSSQRLFVRRGLRIMSETNNDGRCDRAHSTTTTKSHYESHSADSYESAYFYEVGTYTKHLRDLCQTRLQIDQAGINRPRILLDIGGGTGTFTRMLIQDTPGCRAVVVDPFLEKKTKEEESVTDDPVSFVSAPAEAFMTEPSQDDLWWRRDFHQIMLKEVAHHFADQDRVPIFRGMWEGLVPATGPPSLMMITRPQRDIDYPLWDAAREVWAKNQPSLDQFVSELTAAGFSDIQHSIEPYPCVISLERWQSMVKARFWSTFANFSDVELEEACRVIAENEKHRISDDGSLHFEDRLLFITANKR